MLNLHDGLSRGEDHCLRHALRFVRQGSVMGVRAIF
jgi:hypothetical protein